MGEFPTSMMLLEASLAGEVTGEENKREYVAGRIDEKSRFATQILICVMAPSTADQRPQKPVCLQDVRSH